MQPTTLTAEELENVTGGVAGKKQPTMKVQGSNSVSKPLSESGNQGPQPLAGNLPQLSPVPMQQPIVAQQVVGKGA
jgi:hypothetical protein